MEEMKVIVKWEGDPLWMNPDNLLLALRAYCPNTEFECEYTKVHAIERAAKGEGYEVIGYKGIEGELFIYLKERPPDATGNEVSIR